MVFREEEQPEGQRLIGEQIKNDISVPIGSIEEFITRAIEICSEVNPNLRINYFGHMGMEIFTLIYLHLKVMLLFQRKKEVSAKKLPH